MRKRHSILGIYIVNIFTMNATLISNHLFLLGSDHFHLFNLKFINLMFINCGHHYPKIYTCLQSVDIDVHNLSGMKY